MKFDFQNVSLVREVIDQTGTKSERLVATRLQRIINIVQR